MGTLAKDLTVSLKENRLGRLWKAIKAIAKAGINIDGYAGIEGIFHVLTNDPRAAGARGCRVPDPRRAGGARR